MAGMVETVRVKVWGSLLAASIVKHRCEVKHSLHTTATFDVNT